jgi:hypothetical protein
MKTGCCHTHHYHKVEKQTICLNPSCESYLGFTTTYRDTIKVRRSVAVALFIFSVMFTFDDYSKNIVEPGMPKEHKQELPLTLENLADELHRQNILCEEEVLVQIRLESANLKSFLTKKTNNMLGMRYPAKRATKACGIYLPGKDTIITGTQKELRKYSAQNNYAVYATWQDAVADYKLWQEFNFKVTDKYLEFLGKVYAEDEAYVEKIRKGLASAK